MDVERADYIKKTYTFNHLKTICLRNEDFIFFVKPGIKWSRPPEEEKREDEWDLPTKIMADICGKLDKEILAKRVRTPLMDQYYSRTALVTTAEQREEANAFSTYNDRFTLVCENIARQMKEHPSEYNKIMKLGGMQPIGQEIPKFNYLNEEPPKIIGQVDNESELSSLPYFDLPGIQIRYADPFPIISKDMNPRPISRFVGPFLLKRSKIEGESSSSEKEENINVFIHYILRDSNGKPYMEEPETIYDGRIFCFNPVPPYDSNSEYIDIWFRIINRYHQEILYTQPENRNIRYIPRMTMVCYCPEPEIVPETLEENYNIIKQQNFEDVLKEMNDFLKEEGEPPSYIPDSHEMNEEVFATVHPRPIAGISSASWSGYSWAKKRKGTDKTNEPIPKRMCETLSEKTRKS